MLHNLVTQSLLPRMWERDQDYVLSLVERVREQIVLCRNRNEIISFIKSGLPDIRPRKEGPVGPEPDYSIWFAQIFHDEVGRRGNFPTQTLRRLIPLGKGEAPRGYKWTEKYCLHSHVETLWGGLEGVRAWTDYAMKNGIQFNGTYGYKFPSKKNGGILRKKTFERLKAEGLIPSHFRSEKARMERAEKRRRKASENWFRRGPPTPLSFDPLPVVSSISASKMRSNWRSTGPQATWTAYRSTQVTKPVLRLFDGKRHLSEPPTIVLKAIFKMYDPSRIRLLTKGKATITTAVAPRWVVPPNVDIHPPAVSTIQSLTDRLNQIEHDGFKDRYTWFRLNHILAKAKGLNTTPQ